MLLSGQRSCLTSDLVDIQTLRQPSQLKSILRKALLWHGCRAGRLKIAYNA